LPRARLERTLDPTALAATKDDTTLSDEANEPGHNPLGGGSNPDRPIPERPEQQRTPSAPSETIDHADQRKTSNVISHPPETLRDATKPPPRTEYSLPRE